jgi:hypothetical protein
MGSLTESLVEDATLGWLEGLGYAVLHSPDSAVGSRGRSGVTRCAEEGHHLRGV